MLNTNIAFTLNDVVACFGLITAAAAVWGVCLKISAWAKKPNEEQNKVIAEHGKRLDKIEEALARDKESIKILSTEMHLIIKANHALLKHGIDGNSIEPMKESQAEIDNYLIHK